MDIRYFLTEQLWGIRIGDFCENFSCLFYKTIIAECFIFFLMMLDWSIIFKIINTLVMTISACWSFICFHLRIRWFFPNRCRLIVRCFNIVIRVCITIQGNSFLTLCLEFILYRLFILLIFWCLLDLLNEVFVRCWLGLQIIHTVNE